jgi:hypothetical protein
MAHTGAPVKGSPPAAPTGTAVEDALGDAGAVLGGVLLGEALALADDELGAGAHANE